MRVASIRSVADWLGMAASTTCAFHCVLLPTLLVTETVLPGTLLADELFHRLMALLVLPVAVFALGVGCWRHKDRWVLALGAIGLIGMAASVAHLHDLVGDTGEKIVTVVAAAFLVAAHYRNYKLCRSSDCCHESR